MKKENIFQDLTDATKSLLDMARQLTFNNISDNCLYLISEIKYSKKNAFEQSKIRIAQNKTKIPKDLTSILPELENLYANFYDVNLYVYKAEKKVTIIEIQYYPRTSLDIEYRKKTNAIEAMLHSKVQMPPYYSDTKEKFDINWEFEPFNHKWKMFWWRLNIYFIIKPKMLFLVDSLGALITAFLLFAILRTFNDYIGLPKIILTYLSIIAAIFCVYSMSCFFMLKKSWQPFLSAISIANLLYCCLTMGLVIYYYDSLSLLGITYFFGEIIIICGLVFLERNILKKYTSLQTIS